MSDEAPVIEVLTPEVVPDKPVVDADYEAYKAEKKAAQDKLDAEAAKQAERDKPESKLKKYEEDLRAFLVDVGRHLSLTPPVHPDDVPVEEKSE